MKQITSPLPATLATNLLEAIAARRNAVIRLGQMKQEQSRARERVQIAQQHADAAQGRLYELLDQAGVNGAEPTERDADLDNDLD